MPVIQVKVKPNARQSLLQRLADGTWLAHLKAPPVDGRANAELIALIARHYGCAKAAVAIKAGGAGRTKLVMVPEGANDKPPAAPVSAATR